MLTSGLLFSNPEVMVRNNDRVLVFGSFTVLVTFITAFEKQQTFCKLAQQ
jgi:hypothetical protein